MFDTIIDPNGLTTASALICTAVSLGLGLLAALLFRLSARQPSRSMMITLMVLPALVQAVIMLVNGSIGAGIAVMGAFNLVRFRSAPGSARDICFIFYTMCIGLATGMGYIGFSVMLAVVIGIVLAALNFIPGFRERRDKELLRIVIPESLDYNGVFDEIFKEYLSGWKLVQVKTTAMGTLFDLRYEVTEKDPARQKEMIDKLRVCNGNLTISISSIQQTGESL